MKLIEEYNDVRRHYDPTKNTTRNVLTKYELTKIIGMRVEQLARGAPTLVKIPNTEMQNLHKIVEHELKTRVLPFMVIRTLPTGGKEYWRLVDMIIPGIDTV